MKIAIIGLGYVGLPLANAFSYKYETVGFDINENRVNELLRGYDRTLELEKNELLNSINSNNLTVTCNEVDISDAEIYIITVPTPIDDYKNPDLTPLIKASELVGRNLEKDNIVIYESTVYPGATEDECVPILEKHSLLEYKKDFTCGYSPERINPGDKEHTITKIKKVVSGSDNNTLDKVAKLYESIILAGIHKAPTIKVAEAAKVIENTQRDINIAFVNELSIIFNKLNINTLDVLEAAKTKWNFLSFNPGLVGGHCIGVDPYYLTHKAESIGYHPQIILAGRRVNDNMHVYAASEIIKLMIKNKQIIQDAKVLVLGLTFKQDCPDTRNSKNFDLIKELESFGIKVSAYDPHVNIAEIRSQYTFEIYEKQPNLLEFDAVVYAVNHSEFEDIQDLDKVSSIFNIDSMNSNI